MIPPFLNLKTISCCASLGITGMGIASNGLKNGNFQVNAEENNENTKTISFKTSMMKILTEKQKVPDKNNKSKEIVIVGGGVSGLSTAWTLAKLGHNGQNFLYAGRTVCQFLSAVYSVNFEEMYNYSDTEALDQILLMKHRKFQLLSNTF